MAPLLMLLITSLLSLLFLPSLSLSKPTYVSYPLTNRDAEASLIRSQEADPSDLPEEMRMREFVAAGRAMKARGEKQSGRPRQTGRHRPAVVSSALTYLNESVGEFYLTLSLGTPPKNFILLLDTGSELTWTLCKPCKVCSSTGAPEFDFKKSSSLLTVPCGSSLCSQSLGVSAGCENSTRLCTFALQYGDGSLNAGYMVVDSFHLSKKMSKPFVFGCSVTDIETAPIPSSGLLGLNPGPFSFTSQLLGGPSKLSKRFAYCLPNRLTHLNSQGIILFGDYTLPAKLSYTPLLPPYEPLGHLYYYVKLEGISVGKRFIQVTKKQEGGGLQEGGAIFDSGTALTHLEKHLYAELVAEMRRQTQHLHPFATKGPDASDVCYRVPSNAEELPKVPLIIMHFTGGVELELEPHSVLTADAVDAKGVTFCLAFSTALEGDDLNIIGNYQQQNYWVEHNLQTFSLGLAKVKSCATRG